MGGWLRNIRNLEAVLKMVLRVKFRIHREIINLDSWQFNVSLSVDMSVL